MISGLKVSIDKLLSKISNDMSSSSGSREAKVLPRRKGSVASKGKNGEQISVGLRDRCRLVSCAHSGPAPEKGLSRNWGSRGQEQQPFSSEGKGSIAAGMQSENGENRSPPQQNHHQQEEQTPRLLTLPTILTLGRVAAVPILISTFYMNGRWATMATTSIFIAAAITDWLDGYLARKMRLGSAFGAFLDPVADKLMVAATLVLLCTKPSEISIFGKVPWLLTIPAISIIGREITMSAVREWAASQNNRVLEAVAVNNLGKWKTATQMIALTILLVTRDCSLAGPGIIVASGVVLLYISAGLAIWSLFVYMKKIWRILLK